MRSARRWGVVAALVATVIVAPGLVTAWPVADRELTAAAVLDLARASDDRGWSGQVETRGTLELPSADRFTSVGALFGEEVRLRAWWRDDRAWRVDRLSTAGETDLVRAGDVLTEWRYEGAEVNLSPDPAIRLPRTSDLLPPTLGRRVLEGVDPTAATRLADRRVAGRVALGLRVEPSSRSSVERAEVWVDEATGVPLRVDVYAAGDVRPSFHSEFLDFDDARPSLDRVTFTPPEGADVSYDDVLDIADAAHQYAPLVPPAEVAGLPRRGSSAGAVGVYGAGLTELVAIPLRDREAVPLREQLRRTAGSTEGAVALVTAIGPLGVALTGADGEGGWLVAGTVTGAVLEEAARDLLTGTRFLEESR